MATDINQETLNSLNKEVPEIKVFKLDSTENNEVQKFSSNLDKIDVLFNAVGYVHTEQSWNVTKGLGFFI